MPLMTTIVLASAMSAAPTTCDTSVHLFDDNGIDVVVCLDDGETSVKRQLNRHTKELTNVDPATLQW